MGAVGLALGKIIASIGWKLMSESLVSQVACHTLNALAKSSKNQLDDKLAKAVADTLKIDIK